MVWFGGGDEFDFGWGPTPRPPIFMYFYVFIVIYINYLLLSSGLVEGFNCGATIRWFGSLEPKIKSVEHYVQVTIWISKIKIKKTLLHRPLLPR